MTLDILPMQLDEIEAVDDIWQQAFGPLRQASGSPGEPRTPEGTARDRARLAHFCKSDPAGSLVAHSEGHTVGFAQAHVREGTFVLAMLAVLPNAQDRGVGRALLEQVLQYSEGCRAQYIFSSMDPRALHRYVRAGFSLHPAVSATGRPPRAAPTVPPTLRLCDAAAEAIEFIAGIDRAVRHSARSVDIEFMLQSGQRLLLDERGGYALFSGGRVSVLAARSQEIACSLLAALFSGYPDSQVTQVGWIVAEQQWAIETAAQCGASLRVEGAIMTRGGAEFPIPYLPNGLAG